jgi:hypothetical protein
MTKEEKINRLIAEGCDTNLISDGHHTFRELYEHRNVLFTALCRKLMEAGSGDVWRAKAHSDGRTEEEWFVLGWGRASGEQITYHLPISMWDETGFAIELEKAPEWDGHTGDDVLERLARL